MLAWHCVARVTKSSSSCTNWEFHESALLDVSCAVGSVNRGDQMATGRRYWWRPVRTAEGS
jgi:hypothetical protein